jgi:PAS domain-containing protein
MNVSFVIKLIGLVFIGLGVVFVVEPLDPSTTSAPFLLGIILMALSLRQSTGLVVATSVIYSGMTIYDLITFIDYVGLHLHPVYHPGFWLFQRMGLFLVVCAMAIYLAFYRVSTQSMLGHVQTVLAKLPSPVVISDATGNIVYANEALASIFKQNAAGMIGKRYVEVLLADIQEGKAMRYYIEIFADAENTVHELEIKPSDNATKMKARLTCFGAGTNRVLITVIDTMKPAESIRRLTSRVTVPQST